MENSSIYILHNSERLNPEVFGSDAIVQESKITRRLKIDIEKPSFVSYYVHKNELDDETSLLQYG